MNRPAIDAYYELLAPIYQMLKGESMHFEIFSGAESTADAVRATERALADEGGFTSGMLVLDVGCGMGGPALNIAAYSGAQVVGIDLVASNIETARRLAAERGLGHQVRFEQADATAMAFPDASFDAVYMFDAVCHMPDQGRVFRECARVLRPGGRLVGQDWMARADLSAEVYATYLEPVCRWHCVPRLASLHEVRTWLQAGGLAVEVLEDAAARGDILRNWEPVQDPATKALLDLPQEILAPALDTLLNGGAALARAMHAGAFQIGRFRARKPV